MVRKKKEPVKRVVFKEKIDLNSVGARQVIDEIKEFLRKHNISDCTIDMRLEPDYYDTFNVVHELYYEGPDPNG